MEIPASRVRAPDLIAYLIRHGQSTANVNAHDLRRRMTPDEMNAIFTRESELTDHGREQIAACATTLAGQPITRIYASPYRRTQQSAEILAAVWGVPIITIETLHEVDVALTSIRATQARSLRRYGIEVLWHFFGGPFFRAPTTYKGEQFRAVYRRAVNAWQTITDQHPQGEHFAVVSHEGFLRVLTFYLNRHPNWILQGRDFRNAGISVVRSRSTPTHRPAP